MVFPPEQNYWENQRIAAAQNEIIQTQDADLPEWLGLYLAGGIAEIESSYRYQEQYIFVGSNRGNNFNALVKWAEGFNVSQDFPQLAAFRIENRMISAAALYPDDEYGDYFEALIRLAFDTQYPGAVKEETYWIKTRTGPGEAGEFSAPVEQFEFYVLISINKELMQDVINNLLINVRPRTEPTRSQKAAIALIQKNFFDGF